MHEHPVPIPAPVEQNNQLSVEELQPSPKDLPKVSPQLEQMAENQVKKIIESAIVHSGEFVVSDAAPKPTRHKIQKPTRKSTVNRSVLGEQRNCTAETLEKELENLTPICKIQTGIIRDIPDDLDHPANDNQ